MSKNKNKKSKWPNKRVPHYELAKIVLKAKHAFSFFQIEQIVFLLHRK
jgi:hypothetical protein